MTDHKEILEIVDRDGRVTGLAERSVLHGNPSLIHRVVHVLVFNGKGELLLQKRSLRKDVAPGLWDTSVGGHVNPGEALPDAALREMKEEIGISAELTYLYQYLFTNHKESELVTTFSCVYDGEITFDAEEIDEVRHWRIEEVRENIGQGIFSRHFESEITKYLGSAV